MLIILSYIFGNHSPYVFYVKTTDFFPQRRSAEIYGFIISK